MLNKFWRHIVTAVVFIGSLPSAGAAQGLETLGNRAAGLSAFVAVADDASAVAWNPAGLIMGPLFNLSLDLGRSTSVPDEARVIGGGRAGRVSTALIAFAVPPLGLSYYRIGATAVAGDGSAVGGSPGRQEGQVFVRSLVTSHLGATVLQSLGDHVTVGTTIKFVHGRMVAGTVAAETWDEGFDRAEVLESRGSTRGDLDAGAMFAIGRVRAGLVVRNILEPTFGDVDIGEPEMTLARHARGGIAWGDRWPGVSRTVVAVDADMTRVPHPVGDRRDVAAGIERWLRGRQIGLRAGVRASTIGDARVIVSGGASYGVRAGTYVDAYVARGRRDDRAWGIAGRLTY